MVLLLHSFYLIPQQTVSFLLVITFPSIFKKVNLFSLDPNIPIIFGCIINDVDRKNFYQCHFLIKKVVTIKFSC